MKRTAMWMAAAAMLAVQPVKAADPARQQLAEELLTIMKAKESIEQSFGMIKKMMPQADTNATDAAAGSANTAILDLLQKQLTWDSMKADYIALYAETFTVEEMKGIIAFYKSPIGQKFVDKQPELMKRSMEVSQKKMAEIMPQIQALSPSMEGMRPSPMNMRPPPMQGVRPAPTSPMPMTDDTK